MNSSVADHNEDNDNDSSSIRSRLPQSLLVGYTTNQCDDLSNMTKVIEAVQNGVNVLIWSFLHYDVFREEDDDEQDSNTPERNDPYVVVLRGGVSSNMSNFWQFKQTLRKMGYGHVIHLVAFGGWNGKHLPSGISGDMLYDTWKTFNTVVDGPDVNDSTTYYFDGLDWDLEGQDDMNGPRNILTKECLDQMRTISQGAHKDGFIVSMAPAESYLDITSNGFSRQLNLTYEDWHTDFKYHGRNAYAYLLADGHHQNYDFIQVQFYESYSHAGFQILRQHMSPTTFLVNYVEQLLFLTRNSNTSNNNDKAQTVEPGYHVNFEEDSSVKTKNQFIPLPLRKLVFGFANGWALNKHDNPEKTIFINPKDIQQAFQILSSQKRVVPRGCMFWVIEEEGTNDIEFAKGLNTIQACGASTMNAFSRLPPTTTSSSLSSSDMDSTKQTS